MKKQLIKLASKYRNNKFGKELTQIIASDDIETLDYKTLKEETILEDKIATLLWNAQTLCHKMNDADLAVLLIRELDQLNDVLQQNINDMGKLLAGKRL